MQDGVRQSITTEFEKHIESAFTNKESVAYETNFHTTVNLDLAKEARRKGYNTSLYFLALESAELGIERVGQRVKEGGHNVNEETIRER